MRLWRRLTGRVPGGLISVDNSWGLGNGSPLLVERNPDLARLLDDPDPPPPQKIQGDAKENGWPTPDKVRFGLVMAYLGHPDPQVRVAALQQAVQRFGHTVGMQSEIVDMAADPDPVVHIPAVRALWSLQGDTHCERAVMELRDEIRGHTALGFATESLRIGPERSVDALDRMIEHAPDDAARDALRALIDKHVVIPDRIPRADTSEVRFVETTHRHQATYEVYRAPGRDQAITYLKSRPVHKELYYLEVETPEGTFGRDIKGIYSL